MNDNKLIVIGEKKNHPSNKGKQTYKYSPVKGNVDYLPNRIEQLRQALFMSKADICSRADVTQTNYNAIVTGDRQPHTATMLRIAKALEIEPPCDIYIFPSEEMRKVAHDAWYRLNPRVEETPITEISTSLNNEIPSSDEDDFSEEEPVTEVAVYQPELIDIDDLMLPTGFDAETVREVLKAIGSHLNERDGGISQLKLTGMIDKWLQALGKDDDESRGMVTALFTEVFSRG